MFKSKKKRTDEKILIFLECVLNELINVKQIMLRMEDEKRKELLKIIEKKEKDGNK